MGPILMTSASFGTSATSVPIISLKPMLSIIVKKVHALLLGGNMPVQPFDRFFVTMNFLPPINTTFWHLYFYLRCKCLNHVIKSQSVASLLIINIAFFHHHQLHLQWGSNVFPTLSALSTLVLQDLLKTSTAFKNDTVSKYADDIDDIVALNSDSANKHVASEQGPGILCNDLDNIP